MADWIYPACLVSHAIRQHSANTPEPLTNKVRVNMLKSSMTMKSMERSVAEDSPTDFRASRTVDTVRYPHCFVIQTQECRSILQYTPSWQGLTPMGIVLSTEVKTLVDRPNFAHLATIMSDGSPHSTPVWVAREGDLLLVCIEAGSLKGKNTSRDPRISLSIVDFADPYMEVQIRGRVVERRPDPEFKYYDAISHKYTGESWPYRDEKSRVVLVIEVMKAHYSAHPFQHTPPSTV